MKTKPEKKQTSYIVFRSEAQTGPFYVVGNYMTHGQIAAKKAAALGIASVGEDAESSYFVAVPASSFYPQKPTVQMMITFSADGREDDEPEEDDEPGEDDDELGDMEDVLDVDDLLSPTASFGTGLADSEE